jgi:hypothetical protein
MSSPCHTPMAPSSRIVQSKEILEKKHLKLHIGVQRGVSKVVEVHLISSNDTLWAALPRPTVRLVLGWPPIGSRVVENISSMFDTPCIFWVFLGPLGPFLRFFGSFLRCAMLCHATLCHAT